MNMEEGAAKIFGMERNMWPLCTRFAYQVRYTPMFRKLKFLKGEKRTLKDRYCGLLPLR